MTEELQSLIRDLGSQNSGTRRSAALALGNRPDAGEATPFLHSALADSVDYVTTAACDALAKIGGAEAHAALLQALQHHNPFVREHVLLLVGVIWLPTDYEIVRQCFERDTSVRVQRAAGWLLRERAHPDHWRELFALWRTDDLPRHRVWACELASNYRDASLRADLIPLSDDPDGHVRKAALEALLRLDQRA